MNILINTQKNKQILQADDFVSDIALSKIPDNYRKNKDFLRKAKYGFKFIANNNLEGKDLYCSNQDLESNPDNIKILVNKSSSSAGHDEFINIIPGNILLIEDSMSLALDRSIEMQKIFFKQGFFTRSISFREFASMTVAEQFNQDIHYIVRCNRYDYAALNSQQYNNQLFLRVLTYFSNILVFSLPKISHASSTQPSSTTNATTDDLITDIMNKFGLNRAGSNLTIRQLLSSLQANEFVAISGNQVTMGII